MKLMDMIQDKSRKVEGAGMGYDGQPGFAYHKGETTLFFAYLKVKEGQWVVVHSPKLSAATAQRWIHQRIQHFHDQPEGRESIDDAVRRKVIAAHGNQFIASLRKRLDQHEMMELDMMLSPDSHTGIANYTKGHVYDTVQVSMDGTVKGANTGLSSA